jgi:hypothetical protein
MDDTPRDIPLRLGVILEINNTTSQQLIKSRAIEVEPMTKRIEDRMPLFQDR